MSMRWPTCMLSWLMVHLCSTKFSLPLKSLQQMECIVRQQRRYFLAFRELPCILVCSCIQQLLYKLQIVIRAGIMKRCPAFEIRDVDKWYCTFIPAYKEIHIFNFVVAIINKCIYHWILFVVLAIRCLTLAVLTTFCIWAPDSFPGFIEHSRLLNNWKQSLIIKHRARACHHSSTLLSSLHAPNLWSVIPIHLNCD